MTFVKTYVTNIKGESKYTEKAQNMKTKTLHEILLHNHFIVLLFD